MKKNKSIQHVALHSISLSGILSVALLGIFLLYWGQVVLTSHLTEASKSHSKSMLVGLEALMKKGANAQELQEMVKEMNQSFDNADIRLITNEFTKLDSVDVMRDGESVTVQYPVIVKEQCVRCHVSDKVGVQKAVIAHKYPVSEVVFSFSDVLALLIAFSFITFLLMFGLTYFYLKNWVIKPLKDLSHFIDQINSHDELDFIEKTSDISEVENIREAFNRLGKALSQSYIQSVYMAETDELTGVGNRRQMQEVLNLEIERANQMSTIFSIFLLDLNGFKAINDNLGHKVGDDALIHFTNVAKQVLRHEDFIFRLGGDEFLLLLKSVQPGDIDVVKKRIHYLLENNPLQVGEGHDLILKASIGSSCYPEDSGDMDELIQKADKAMYQAKHHFYEPQNQLD